MSSTMLTPGRAMLLVVATGAMLVAGCHSKSNPVVDGCTTSMSRAKLDSAKTAADTNRVLAREVPVGGTGC
ncbi:MAG: hypothetical protein ACREK8_08315 [Gemmatimonadales bacterium]